MRACLAIPLALKAAIGAALPLASVVGMDGEESIATRIDAGGRVVVRAGDPGEPEIDLSPLSYNYAQRISVEVAAASEDELDAMLGAIGAVIEADRTLGGLCTWLEAFAPETEDLFVEGGRPPRACNLMVTASYTTPHPLT